MLQVISLIRKSTNVYTFVTAQNGSISSRRIVDVSRRLKKGTRTTKNWILTRHVSVPGRNGIETPSFSSTARTGELIAVTRTA